MKPRVRQAGQLLIILLAAGFLGLALTRNWHELNQIRLQLSYPLLVLAFTGFIYQQLSYAAGWGLILRRLGVEVSVGKAMRLYLASEFVRYIPGNVWHLLARMVMGEREGISKPMVLLSTTIQLATMLIGGLLIFLLSVPFWQEATRLERYLPFLLLVPVLVALLHPRLLTWSLNQGLQLLKKPAITLTLGYADLLLITLFWLVSWAVSGLAFYFLVSAVHPLDLSLIPVCMGIYALGWVVGFMSFLTPSGLVVREGVISFLLSFYLLSPLAIALALLARFVATLAEVVCVAGFYAGWREERYCHEQRSS